MKAHKLLTLIQSSKPGRNNRSMQPLYSEDTVAKSRRLASAQLREPLSKTSLNRDFLVKQYDRLYQLFLRFAVVSQEPKVTWKRDRQGRSHFQIYNPSTEKYHYFDSEQDALIWLDRDRFGSVSRSRAQKFAEGENPISKPDGRVCR